MASSKRPTYKVETNLATERKRRKSDLVIMWQSIWSVTMIILKDLRITLLQMWEFIQPWFSSSERFTIQAWLGKYLPYVPEDFSESWRDGRLLAILLNKLRPGCFPDAHKLDPDYGLKNVYRVFDALEIYFGIKPNVSVEEIVTCTDGSDSKLFEILLELKNFTENQAGQQDQPEPEPKESNEQCGQWQSEQEICIAKGTGLAVGFVGKITSIVIFCAVMSDLDVVVEIRGPNTICSERITKRSPKRKRSMSAWECVRPLVRSVSFNEDNDKLVTEEDDNFEKRLIPLEYEIVDHQINLSYKPKEKGEHKVTILWHRQHVSDSPYFVTVEDPSDLAGINNIIHLKSALKATNECGRSDVIEKSRKISVRFQESSENCKEQKKSGKILSRRVLRYIVKIQGKDIPVNAENTESLAAELLKMDYDFEKWPSFHRRNSWGFAGDAERKKSVIRQFCVDVNELDAQISLRRSRSLSLSPVSKKLMQKSDSFESLTTNLNIVNEDNCEKHQENEEDYAYINPDANETSQADEVMCNDVGEMYQQINVEGEKSELSSELSSELTQSKFVESLPENPHCEKEADQISSLSKELVSVEQVDNSDRDLRSSSPPCSSFNETNIDELNKTPSDMKLHHEIQSNEYVEKDTETAKCFETSANNKMSMKNSKRKNHTNDIQNQSRSFKKRRIKRKTASFRVQTFCRKVTTNKPLQSLNILEQTQGNSKQMLKIRKNISPKVSENLEIKDSMKEEKHIYEFGSDAKNFSFEKLNSSRLEENAKSKVNNVFSINEQCSKNVEGEKSTNVNHTSRNIIQDAKTNNASKDMVQELKTKKLDLNTSFNTKTTPCPDSKVETEDKNICKTKPPQTHTLKPVEQFFINHNFSTSPASCKKSEADIKDANAERAQPLRTHTLKVIEQFNFKQFSPPFEAQSSNISPIKAQIGRWESTLSSEKQNVNSQNTCASDTEQVNVKQRLAFWENAYKSEQKFLQQNTEENNRKMDLNKKLCKSIDDNSDSTGRGRSTDNKSFILAPFTKEKREACISINKETNVAAKKQTDDKISAELQLTSARIKRRSFSDPVMLETTLDETDAPVNFSSFEYSTVYSSSSTDDNLEHCDSCNSGDSGCDYILQSTEDEYIDDEISESASEYWGNLNIAKDWKILRCATEFPFLGEEFLENYQRNKSHPEQCKVFGIAIYYGHVAVKNRFQVYTGDAGFGNLSVSMQGFRRHDVSLVSIAYFRNDIYEVTYQVMTAGYYLISIRWMDKEIPGSPFVCKVTF